MNFQQLMIEELIRAREKHPKKASVHEAYAVILEELDEFWDLVRQKHPRKEQMLEELVQIAAMCQATVEDLELIS